MNSLSSLRLAKAAVIAGLAGLSLLAAAADPGAKKPERRVPPTAPMGEIPAGVDSGTPTTQQFDAARHAGAAVAAIRRPGRAEPALVGGGALRRPADPDGGEQRLRQADRPGDVTTVQKKPPAKTATTTTTTTAAKPASAPTR